MSRVLITGSTDGLGQLAARNLIDQGHHVVVHGRTVDRLREAASELPGAAAALIGDLSSVKETIALAEQANDHGRFDAVIHNAAVGPREARRIETAEGLCHVFAINVLAPYLLTSLMLQPRRLVYMTSATHLTGDPSLADLQWRERPWSPRQAYADSKLYDTLLAFAVARLWRNVLSNAVGPGWVPTKMGGLEAPDDLDQGHHTQAWLAVSDDPAARVTGRYFHHRVELPSHPAASDQALQDRLLEECRLLSGVALPGT